MEEDLSDLFDTLDVIESDIDLSKIYGDMSKDNIDQVKNELSKRSYEINRSIITNEIPFEINVDKLIEKLDNIEPEFLKAILPDAPRISEEEKALITYWNSVNVYAEGIEKISSSLDTRVKETLLKNIGSGGTSFKDLIKINYVRGERIPSSINYIPKLINTSTTFADAMRNMNEFTLALKSDPDFRNIVQNMVNEAKSASKKEKFTLEYYNDNSINLLNPDVISTVTYFMILIENGLSPTIAMITYSKLLSGCYIFTSDKSTKLENCNYYQNPENIFKCSCGNIDTDTISIPDCTNLSADECDKPYCLGKTCTNKISTDQCTIDGKNIPKCTKSNIDDKNYVYYTYLNYQPLTFIPIAKLINKKFYNKYLATKGKKNNFLKYFLIFLSIILIILLIMFLYNRFLKKKKL
jgi:hypothetical protein